MKRAISLSVLLSCALLASGCAYKHPWFHKAPAAAPCGPCGGAPPAGGAYAYPPPVAPAVPPPAVSNLGPTPDIQGPTYVTPMPARR